MDHTLIMLCGLLMAKLATLFMLVEFATFIIVVMLLIGLAVSFALLGVSPPHRD